MHANGPRARAPFVSENCAAVPEPLLESTLFGHVRGAFTGASQTRAGLFEVADGGTLFLDEIGEMPLAMQAKLLRVLQDGEVRAVGCERTRKVERAHHRARRTAISKRWSQNGTFREDLYLSPQRRHRAHAAAPRAPRRHPAPRRAFLEKHARRKESRA